MEDIIKNALMDYKAEFGSDFDPTWNPATEEDLIQKLQASRVDFDVWRSKHSRMWKALRAIVIPISNLGKIASNITQGAYPPAAAATAGLMTLVTACEKVSEAYDFVETMFVKLEDSINRWKIDLRHEVDKYARQKMQQIVLVILAVIARSRKLMNRRTKQYFARLIFGKDQKTADLLQTLDDLILSEDRARLTVSLEKISSLWEKAIKTESTMVVERLNSVAVKTNGGLYGYRLEDKLLDSGQWFKDEPLTQQWMQNDIPLLLTLGGPGSGKSFLATGLIEELIRRHQPNNTTGHVTSVAYFYIEQDNDLVTMLKTMAYQMQATNPEFRKHIIETFDQGDLYTAKEVWAKLFLDFWDQHLNPDKRAILVIDGLSEATPAEIDTFAQDMIKPMMKDSEFNIQVAIFGRISLWDDFRYLPPDGYVEIDSRKNKKDISSYIGQQVSKIRAVKRCNIQQREELESQILEQCDGIFEWARLLLSICKGKEMSTIRKLLNNPPKDLNAMIKKCFDQILLNNDIDPDMLRTLLIWLTYEKRPLRFGELYNAVYESTGEEHALLWRNIVRSLSSIIRWRASHTRQIDEQALDDDDGHVEILSEDGHWSKHTSTTLVFLGNAKIRDHVVEQGKQAEPDEDGIHRWPPPPNQSEYQIVRACIQMLQREDVTKKENRFLLHYPLRFMALHLQGIELEALNQEEKTTVATGLIWLFHNPKGNHVMALDCGNRANGGVRAFWRLWIEHSRNTTLVQKWLRWAVESHIQQSSEEANWSIAASRSLKELLRPFGEYCRRCWLTSDLGPKPMLEFEEWGLVSTAALNFLVAYDNMNDDEEFPNRCNQAFQMEGRLLTDEDYLSIAEKGNLPQDATYCLALSLAYANNGRSILALEWAAKVPENDRVSWLAALNRATSYASQYNTEKSLYWAEVAAAKNPDARGYVNSLIPNWLLLNNDLAGAVKAAQSALKSTGEEESNRVITNYFKCLKLQKSADAIVKFAQEIHQQQMKDKRYSRLIGAMNGATNVVWSALGHAYIFSDKQDHKAWILNIVQGGVVALAQSEGEREQLIWLNRLAQFLWRYVENGPERSVELLLRNIARIKESNFLLDHNERTYLLISSAAQAVYWIYRYACEQEFANDPKLLSTIQILKDMANDSQQIDRSLLSTDMKYRAHYPCFFYGRWLRDHKPANDGIWRQYFRKPLLNTLGMLDDENPVNDVTGCIQTSGILTMAGETINADAILALPLLSIEMKIENARMKALHSGAVTPNEQDSIKPSSNKDIPTQQHDEQQKPSMLQQMSILQVNEPTALPQTSTLQEDTEIEELSMDIDLYISCGNCYARGHKLDALYECRTCFHALCKACLPQGKIHSTYGRECGSHHQFRQVWPVPEKLRHVAMGRKDGKLGVKKEWLEAMKAEWKEPEPGKDDTS